MFQDVAVPGWWLLILALLTLAVHIYLIYVGFDKGDAPAVWLGFGGAALFVALFGYYFWKQQQPARLMAVGL